MALRLARSRLAICLVCLVPALFLAACERDGQAPSGTDAPGGIDSPASEVTATPFVLPTLLPTETASAPLAQTATPPPSPTSQPQATLDFEQPVVAFRYRIPVLGLDRRLEGNVNGQITVVDETRGVAAIRHNQGGVLLELQGLLPTLELASLPDGCDTCVAFSYTMPLEDAAGEGWLQDAVLLASVENYTTALLGPHFPPDSVLGLRRSATAYDVAHTLALDSGGMLYRWLATSAEVGQPVDVSSAAPELPDMLEALDTAALQEQYVVDCMSAPVETLVLQSANGNAAEEDAQSIRVVCPAFSLPPTLLPLYVQLDHLLQDTLQGSGVPRPPSAVALDAVLDYRRDDGAHLEVAWDGVARITRGAGRALTTTVTNTVATTITSTLTTTLSADQVMSVTTSLLDSGMMQAGLESFTAAELENTLFVRGERGMLELAWAPGQAPEAVIDELQWLDNLLETE